MAELFSVVDSSWELIDPNPDIHQLFHQFNETFFDGRLGGVYVQWSPRMTLCAGTCKFHPRNRECSIQLSKPLLSYRPRKDLVETLLHEMIHAFLFMADGDRERESHGPKFHEHMYRINKMTGANISVYHTFHDEVSHFKTHWWKCNGPCQHRHPFYGIVKRSMNRAPGPNDFWHKEHQANCGGSFVKIKEPEPKKAVKRKKDTETGGSTPAGDEKKTKNKITNYFERPASATATATTTAPPTPTPGTSTQGTIPPATPEPKSFSGGGFALGFIGSSPQPSSSSSSLLGSSSGAATTAASLSSGNKLGTSTSQQQRPPARGEHPLFAKWMQNYKTDLSSVPGRSTSTSGASSTPRNQATGCDFGNSSASTSSTIREVKKRPEKRIEVIELD